MSVSYLIDPSAEIIFLNFAIFFNFAFSVNHIMVAFSGIKIRY